MERVDPDPAGEPARGNNTPPTRRTAALLALLVVFLWATSWVLIKIGLQQIPALTFAGLRYFLAFLILLVFSVATGRSSDLRGRSRSTWLGLVGLGLLLYALTQGAQFLALSYLPAITANLLWSFSPIAVALLGASFLDERPSVVQAAGVLLAVVGALIYFFPPDLPVGSMLGLAIAAIGVLANAGAAVLGRGIGREKVLSPVSITTASMGVGGVILLAAGLTTQGMPPIDWRGWLIIAWLALINTAFAFTLWNLTLQSLSATESSVINGTMLIWIPLLAVVFLGESITALQLAALALAGIGTMAVQLGARPGTSRPPVPSEDVG